MIALLQRVAEAAVLVNKNIETENGDKDHEIGRIGPGTLALVGVQRGDNEETADRLLKKVLAWRMFEDGSGKMNLNLSQVDGGLLLVPQFTLAADTQSGNRPSFSTAAPPSEGKAIFDYFVEQAKMIQSTVETGQFGADMNVTLVNDGPVTFWLEV